SGKVQGASDDKSEAFFLMANKGAEWDAKYRDAADQGTATEPSPIVRELLPLLSRGDALDLACGAGRHAVLLAQEGYHVTGIDASGGGLRLAEEGARAAGIDVRRKTGLEKQSRGPARCIDLVEADLEMVALPAESFDVILCVHYLQRSLFPQIER